jgi:hypothetical protein
MTTANFKRLEEIITTADKLEKELTSKKTGLQNQFSEKEAALTEKVEAEALNLKNVEASIPTYTAQGDFQKAREAQQSLFGLRFTLVHTRLDLAQAQKDHAQELVDLFNDYGGQIVKLTVEANDLWAAIQQDTNPKLGRLNQLKQNVQYHSLERWLETPEKAIAKYEQELTDLTAQFTRV